MPPIIMPPPKAEGAPAAVTSAQSATTQPTSQPSTQPADLIKIGPLTDRQRLWREMGAVPPQIRSQVLAEPQIGAATTRAPARVFLDEASLRQLVQSEIRAFELHQKQEKAAFKEGLRRAEDNFERYLDQRERDVKNNPALSRQERKVRLKELDRHEKDFERNQKLDRQEFDRFQDREKKDFRIWLALEVRRCRGEEIPLDAAPATWRDIRRAGLDMGQSAARFGIDMARLGTATGFDFAHWGLDIAESFTGPLPQAREALLHGEQSAQEGLHSGEHAAQEGLERERK